MSTHDDEFELVGPEDGGWYRTQVHDWIALCPEVPHYAYRVYVVMRSLCIEKRAPVRRLTIEELRRLVPGVNGKEPGRSTVEGALRSLRSLGLIEALDAATSGGAIRYRINDMPPNSTRYGGWRNTFEKLEHIREEIARERSPEGEQPTQNSEQGTQNSEQGTQKTEQGTQNSESSTPADQRKPATPRSTTRRSTRSSTKNAHHADRPGLFDVDSSDSSDGSQETDAGNPTDLAFERFWKFYPRKTAKQDARRAFEKAAKKHGPDLLVQQAERWGGLWARAGFEKQFIPYPTTWLNGERWTDEQPAPRQPLQRAVNGGHSPYRNANPDAYHANF